MRSRWIRLAGLLALLGAGYLAARWTGTLEALGTREGRAAMVEAMRAFTGRWWVGPAFALAYALLVALALPASALTIVGGAAFGLIPGILWVTLGANLGANLAFWLARRLGRGALEALLGARLGAFDRITGVAGFQGLLALRLLPIAPFVLLNYGAGLTGMSARDYALATAIGILPGTVVYVFFADALVAGSAEAGRGALVRALGAGALLVAFSLVTHWLLRRRARVARITSTG
ncbi:MAG TPA: VTT domain-containing protein [Gemmatimonadales bacterium]|nr:VTT domain-containing protein [Gemmatimonadales bacterium]